LIMTTSAFLSVVVYIVIGIIDSYVLSVRIYLGVCGGGLLLIPALLGSSLVQISQICLARRQSIQR
jgi:hypothetical protein